MLNENIRELRKAKGLSQEELAVRLNVVRQTVSKWEQGLSVPDADMLVAIGEVFDTPVGILLGETVTPPQPDELRTISESSKSSICSSRAEVLSADGHCTFCLSCSVC